MDGPAGRAGGVPHAGSSAAPALEGEQGWAGLGRAGLLSTFSVTGLLSEPGEN